MNHNAFRWQSWREARLLGFAEVPDMERVMAENEALKNKNDELQNENDELKSNQDIGPRVLRKIGETKDKAVNFLKGVTAGVRRKFQASRSRKEVPEEETKPASKNRAPTLKEKEESNADWNRRYVREKAKTSGNRAANRVGYKPYSRTLRRMPKEGDQRTKFTRGVGLSWEKYTKGKGWERTALVESEADMKAKSEQRARVYEEKLAAEKSRRERALTFANAFNDPDARHIPDSKGRARMARKIMADWDRQRTDRTELDGIDADEHPMRYGYGQKLEMYERSRKRGDVLPPIQLASFERRSPNSRREAPQAEPRMESDASFDAWHRDLWERARNPDNFTDPELKRLSAQSRDSKLTYGMYRAVVDTQFEREKNKLPKIDRGIYDRDGNGVLIVRTANGKGNITYIDRNGGEKTEVQDFDIAKAEEYAKQGILLSKMKKHLEQDVAVSKQPKAASKINPALEKGLAQTQKELEE